MASPGDPAPLDRHLTVEERLRLNAEAVCTHAPFREVHSRWGVLYASSTDAESVRFSTTSPEGQPETALSINGVAHAFDIGFRRGPAAESDRPGFWDLDSTWHVAADEALHSLRRPDAGEVTHKAWARVRDELFPELVRWLGTDTGQSLLDDGRAHQMSQHMRLATDASMALHAGLDRVRSIKGGLVTGSDIDAADLRFLGRVVDSMGDGPERTQRAAWDVDRVRRRLDHIAGREPPGPPSL